MGLHPSAYLRPAFLPVAGNGLLLHGKAQPPPGPAWECGSPLPHQHQCSLRHWAFHKQAPFSILTTKCKTALSSPSRGSVVLASRHPLPAAGFSQASPIPGCPFSDGLGLVSSLFSLQPHSPPSSPSNHTLLRQSHPASDGEIHLCAGNSQVYILSPDLSPQHLAPHLPEPV